jgi:hypothetical protein
MMEKEEQQPEIKVNDRRKFNLDGSLREGVEITPPKNRKKKSAPRRRAAEPPKAFAGNRFAPICRWKRTTRIDETDIPGAEDPASFVNFLSTLATNAAAALGAMPHPATGQRSVDLETGKYWLDVLGC